MLADYTYMEVLDELDWQERDVHVLPGEREEQR